MKIVLCIGNYCQGIPRNFLRTYISTNVDPVAFHVDLKGILWQIIRGNKPRVATHSVSGASVSGIKTMLSDHLLILGSGVSRHSGNISLLAETHPLLYLGSYLLFEAKVKARWLQRMYIFTTPQRRVVGTSDSDP